MGKKISIQVYNIPVGEQALGDPNPPKPWSGFPCVICPNIQASNNAPTASTSKNIEIDDVVDSNLAPNVATPRTLLDNMRTILQLENYLFQHYSPPAAAVDATRNHWAYRSEKASSDAKNISKFLSIHRPVYESPIRDVVSPDSIGGNILKCRLVSLGM